MSTISHHSLVYPAMYCFLFLFFAAISFTNAAEVKPYLTPHEQNLFDALDNVDKNFQGFKDTFAKDAHCEMNTHDGEGTIVTKSGSFDDVFGFLNGMLHYKVKWSPVTNSDANHPEKGVLGVKFWNYGHHNKGCMGLFSGIGSVKFNKDGLVSKIHSYSTDIYDFMNCATVENEATKMKK